MKACIQTLEKSWSTGGLSFRDTFSNINYNDYANSIVSGFIINKIKTIVKNHSAQKNLIYLDGRGMSTYSNDILFSYDNLVEKSNESSIENDINSIQENDIAFYLYDEHEDSLYKVSHAAMINNSSKIISLNTLTEKDSIVSYLPLSITTNLLFTYITSLNSGMSLNLPESNQTIEKDLLEQSNFGRHFSNKFTD